MVNKDRLIKEFAELVSVPCPSKDERQEAELIMKKLRELGIAASTDSVNAKTGGTCGNVWAYLEGNAPGAPTLFFEAHMDSVSPATGTKVVRRDGALFSDGTTTLGGDDKAGIAAILEAVRAVKEDGIAHGALQLCFTVSEEIGCLGVVNMDRSRIKADFGYCMDAGGNPGEITYAAPKLYDVYVTVTGRAAHAGLAPETGVSALMIAADAISSLPKHGRIDKETTLNVGVFRAGEGANVVAPKAEFVIDMRSLDTAKLERLKDSTIEIIRSKAKTSGAAVDFKVVEGCPAVSVAKDHPCVDLASRAAVKLGFPVRLLTTGGCSDGNYLCGYGLPCVLLATGMSNIHTTEEYLKEEDLYNTARWAYAIIKEAAALGQERP